VKIVEEETVKEEDGIRKKVLFQFLNYKRDEEVKILVF
jgi:hypothetical protein